MLTGGGGCQGDEENLQGSCLSSRIRVREGRGDLGMKEGRPMLGWDPQLEGGWVFE